MSREEAIAFFKDMNECTYGNLEAVEMAIKALEQEPCEDAISRQAALEAFGLSEKARKYGGDHSGYDTLMKYEIQDILEDLPPVTPQQKMGHWEWNQYDANPKIGNFHCSLCHSIGRTYFDYCPYCGAKMSEIQTGAEWSDKE